MVKLQPYFTMAIKSVTTASPIGREGLAFLAHYGLTANEGNGQHTHPISASIRNAFEDWVVRRHSTQRIKDVGGNYARHACRHAGVAIHSCVPILDGTDIVRQVTRDACQGADICNNIFQHCTHEADVYVFNQVMYYLQPEDLHVIPDNAIVYAAHHIYNEPGTYALGEMEVYGDPSSWTVHARGNCVPYVHSECWLSSDCVIPHPDGVLAFKLIQTIETLRIFKGRVYKLPPHRCYYMEPRHIPNDCYISELDRFIAAEIQLTTIDTRAMHLLAMRIRAWCDSRERAHPADIAAVIRRVVDRVTQQTARALADVNKEAIANHNQLVSSPFTVPEPEQTTVWRRVGLLLWSVTLTAMAITTTVATYTMPISRREIHQLASGANATVKHSMRQFLAKFGRARIRAVRWLTSRGWPDVPTCVPSRDTSNELVSIFRRAFPKNRHITIHPAIRHSAIKLARLIGPIDAPQDFSEWVAKYDAVRREQITRALDLPESERVEYFQKIEQLDEIKDPRAIQARCDNFKARMGPWIAALEHRVRERLPFLVKGLDEPAKAAKINILRRRALKVVELDFSRFDRSLSVDLLKATEHYIYQIVFPPKIASIMSRQLYNTVSSRNGATYFVDGTRMSGDMNTSIGNCLIVACLMLAVGMPLDSFVAEGDDMLAVLTDKEVGGIQTKIFTDAGLDPKLAIGPLDTGTFCSRFDIMTVLGPKRIRDVYRAVTRFCYSLNGELDEAHIQRGVSEWAGVPMLGPVYETLAGLPITTILPETRVQFTYLFGISQDEQQAFENDPKFREKFAQEYATAYTSRPRHGYSEIQRATWTGASGDATLPVRPRVNWPGPSRLQRPHVRDVQAKGTSQVPIQSSSGDHCERGSSDGSRLRREGRDTNVHRNGSAITKDDEPGMEGLHSDGASQQGHETEVASDSPRDGVQSRNKRRPSKLPRRRCRVRRRGDMHSN